MNQNDFIRYAIEIEEESAEFYRGMLDLDLKSSTRELVAMLEKEEIRHKEVLSKFTPPEGNEIIQIKPDIELSFPTIPEGEKSVSAVLDMAIRRERTTKEIYQGASQQARGSFKELLLGLATFEKQHEEKLMSMKSYY
jgi:rubrerythrin